MVNKVNYFHPKKNSWNGPYELYKEPYLQTLHNKKLNNSIPSKKRKLWGFRQSRRNEESNNPRLWVKEIRLNYLEEDKPFKEILIMERVMEIADRYVKAERGS